MCSKLYSSSQVGSSDIRPAPKTTPLVPIRLVNSEPGSPTNYYDNSVLFQSPADVNTPTSVEVNSDSVQGKGKWKEGSKPKPLANRSEGNHSNSQSTLGSEIEFNKPLTSGSYLSTNSIVQTANPINSTAMSPPLLLHNHARLGSALHRYLSRLLTITLKGLLGLTRIR